MLFFPKSSLDTTRNERERKAFVFPTPRLPFHVGFCALHQGTILLHSKYADTRQRTDERKVSTVHRRRQQRTDREIHMREQKKVKHQEDSKSPGLFFPCIHVIDHTRGGLGLRKQLPGAHSEGAHPPHTEAGEARESLARTGTRWLVRHEIPARLGTNAQLRASPAGFRNYEGRAKLLLAAFVLLDYVHFSFFR